ncbi:MAG: Eco29kI family restriction endonuclease, partial [Candidatus Binatia bacterium]
IYYTGNFPGYRRIAEGNREGRFEAPIYIGKAVPPGARKGGYSLGESPGDVLFKRLKEHAKSIEQSENLNLADFTCRHLVTDDIWIPLAEALLIEKFKPVWNWIIDGFGIHDPGSGRYQQERSKWDTLHPGRPFAKRLRLNRHTSEQILSKLKAELHRK